MGKYKVEDPQSGEAYIFEGASPPTEAEINLAIQKMTPPQGAIGQAFGKFWGALGKPEQLSRQGLEQIASHFPPKEVTGNLPSDIMRNIPNIAAETMVKGAPPFVNRASLLTMGAAPLITKGLIPLAKLGFEAVAPAAEAMSGLEYKTPGILKEAAKDASLIFGKGKKAAGKIYEAAINTDKIRPLFGQIQSKMQLIKEAEQIAQQGGLTPEEALIARKTLDEAKNELPSHVYHATRQKFDAIAKNISKEADLAYRRAIKSEALRKLLPQNKFGGSSVAKTAVGALIPALLKASSPLMQGTAATGLGLAGRGLGAAAEIPQARKAALSAIAELIQQQPMAKIPDKLLRLLKRKNTKELQDIRDSSQPGG